MTRVAFLFNHDAAHQVAHVAGIARELSAEPGFEISALVSNPRLEAVAREIIGPDAASRIEWRPFLPLSPARHAAPALDRLLPFSRLRALQDHLDYFRTVDILVVTERTSLLVKRRLGAASPRFVYIPHGAGDRNVTYHPQLAQMDLFLVSGRKYVDMASAAGLIHAGNQGAIIGYPKFDATLTGPHPARLFANDNPTFLYNPHFDPHLSSYYRFGEALFGWFLEHSDRYNLVFAPHVMLFRKHVHYSLEHQNLAFRRDVARAYRDAPNILVDTGSDRLFDMTYILSADAYIGDVSSQVYEFLARPRPCFFLDSHGAPPIGSDDKYLLWRAGPVATSVAELGALLPRWREIGADYAAAQQEMFAYTFDVDPRPASARGAAAIAAFARTGTA